MSSLVTHRCWSKLCNVVQELGLYAVTFVHDSVASYWIKLYRTSRSYDIAYSVGDSNVPIWCMVHTSLQTASRSVRPFLQGCSQHTDTHTRTTERATYIAVDRIVAICMWCGLATTRREFRITNTRRYFELEIMIWFQSLVNVHQRMYLTVVSVDYCAL